MMDIDQFHDELRDTFNRDYRLMLIAAYIGMVASLADVESAVDNVLMGERDK